METRLHLSQNLQHRQSVAVADCIADVRGCAIFADCDVSSIAIDKIVHNQFAAQLKLQARECCSRAHLRVATLLGNETVVAQITDRTYSVGLPTYTQAVARPQILSAHGLAGKHLRLCAAAPSQLVAEGLPAVESGISGQHVERSQRYSSVSACGVTPYAFERALGEMLTLRGLDIGDQDKEIGMHAQTSAETALDAQAPRLCSGLLYYEISTRKTGRYSIVFRVKQP